MFQTFDREDMETAVEMLLEPMDTADGDVDLEDDESCSAVDESGRYLHGDELGSEDAKEPDDDAQGDVS